MTAVASVPSIQTLPRTAWPSGKGSQANTSGTNSEDGARMLVPRKSAQRSNSSSSVSSTSSSNSTLSSASFQANGSQNGDANWATRKKPYKSPWPASKAEAVSGMTTARPQTGPASGAPSLATTMMPLQNQAQIVSQPQSGQSQWQQNGAGRNQNSLETPALLHLLPINGTFEAKTITVPFAPDVLRIGRQTNQKTVPTPLNGYFDSKVLSRQHAEIWAERDGKIWIRDVKSSNGTFVNGKRLSPENRDSEPHLLKEQDVLELGIDIVSEDQKTVVHHKVAARVEHAGIYGVENGGIGMTFSDLDSSAVPGVMGQAGLGNGRNRAGSQGSNGNNGRFPGQASGVGMNNMVMAAYHPKWLSPISMEQIVKRINSELKQARAQSSDLRHTTSFLDAVIADDKALVTAQPLKITTQEMQVNLRAQRNSPPSAPPPTQPLPEAPPDSGLRNKLNGLPSLQPLLRRSDTERPKIHASSSGRNSPTIAGPNLQVRNLVEALTTAQSQITSQGEKLKEVEEALRKEREDRKMAEERASRFESGTPSSSNGPDAPTQWNGSAEVDASRLQSLIDVMRAEMDEMRTQMEKYRLRAENAEKSSQRDRTSLAEMVDKIQRREEAVKRRKERRRVASGPDDFTEKRSQGSDSGEEDIEELSIELDGEVERAISHLNGTPHVSKHNLNGKAILPSVGHLQELGKAAVSSLLSTTQAATNQLSSLVSEQEHAGPQSITQTSTNCHVDGQPPRSRAQEQLVQSAPYASLIGVVLLGVGMMAYLNGWQKVVER